MQRLVIRYTGKPICTTIEPKFKRVTMSCGNKKIKVNFSPPTSYQDTLIHITNRRFILQKILTNDYFLVFYYTP